MTSKLSVTRARCRGSGRYHSIQYRGNFKLLANVRNTVTERRGCGRAIIAPGDKIFVGHIEIDVTHSSGCRPLDNLVAHK